MEDIQKEIEEEEELLKPSKEEEVKAAVITKYGLDPVDNAALVEQLVKDRLEDMHRFGKVVGQKRNWREKATKTPPATPPAPTPPAPAFDEEGFLKKAEDRAIARIEERELDSSNLPDDIKAAAKDVARLKGITLKKALEDPYIAFQIDQAVKDGKITEASIRPNHQSIPAAPKPSKGLPKVDLSTSEGQEAMRKHKESLMTD